MKKIFGYPIFLLVCLMFHFYLVKVHLVDLTFVPSLVFLFALFFIVLLEKLFPYREDWNKNLGDFKADIIQTLIVLPLVAKSIEIAYDNIHSSFAIQVWSEALPFWIQSILVIISAEFLFYWYHRLSHTNKFLLKFHAVHHGADRVYWANAGRFHFVDLFFQFSLYFIPVYLFGANKEVVALFLTLNAVTGTLEHANIDFKSIIMTRIFNTAELHRIHHSVKISECNTNYGKILSIWDTVFGTYLKPKFKREEFKAGLPGGRPVPYDFIGQIKYPFKKLF